MRSLAWRSVRTASAWRRGADDQTVKIWDTATGKELFALKGHPGRVTSVAFSPDGHAWRRGA